jgi:hypothetical protein
MITGYKPCISRRFYFFREEIFTIAIRLLEILAFLLLLLHHATTTTRKTIILVAGTTIQP